MAHRLTHAESDTVFRESRDPGIYLRISVIVAAGIAIWLCFVLVAQSLDEEYRNAIATAALLFLPTLLVFAGIRPIGLEFFSQASPGRRVLFLFFLGAGLLGSIISIEPLLSTLYLLANVSLLVLGRRLWAVSEEGVVRGLAWYAPLGAACMIGMTLIFGFDVGERLNSFRNPNGIGLLAYGILIMGLAIPRPFLRWLSVGTAVAMMLLAQSRGSMAGSLIAVGTFFLLRTGKLPIAWRLATVGLAVAAGIGSLFMSDLLWTWANDVFSLDDPYRGLGSGVTGRDVLWAYAWHLFEENPMLGVGFRLHEFYFALSNPDIAGAASAHSGYLAALAELGLLGAIPLFAWIGLQVASGLRRAGTDLSIDSLTFPFFMGYLTIAAFERFLFNLGNPTSIIFMILLVRPALVSVRARRTAR
jgi:O-antigen ligase